MFCISNNYPLIYTHAKWEEMVVLIMKIFCFIEGWLLHFTEVLLNFSIYVYVNAYFIQIYSFR